MVAEGFFYGLTSCFPVIISQAMAIRRLVILAAVVIFLAAPDPAHPSATYVVRKGDTLSSIARRHQVPAKKIQAANRMTSSKVVAGKRLRIPSETTAKSAGKSTGKVAGKVAGEAAGEVAGGAVAAQGPAQVHTVRRGDTIGSISRRYDVSERELLRRNLMKRSRRLKPGTRIVVRAAMPETYTVLEDDTLYGIARKFGMSTEELTALNDLDSGRLVPGRKLVLYDPAGEDPTPAVAGGPPVVATAPVVSEDELLEAAKPLNPAADNQVEAPRDRVIRVAKKLLSTPYVWGGASLTGMDCSGFVWKVFSLLNHNLPRSAREQFQAGREVGKGELTIGDLVFFQTYAKYPSHVGIYLGDNRFIHASSGSRQVRITSMEQPYYVKRYIGAKRMFLGEKDIVD